jgi:proton-dependent oligopeptide transporter, POT family
MDDVRSITKQAPFCEADRQRAILLVAFTEFWERFSYYGLMGLLVLYLTAPVRTGGWGWDEASAVKFYGWYAGAVFAGPVFGAWLANSVLGERRCILIGGLLIMSGHILLAGPVVIPEFAAWATGVDQEVWRTASGASLGWWTPDAATAATLKTSTSPQWALAVYRAAGMSFLLGLGLIVTGTALIKPAISSIIAQFYDAGDSARDEGFALFFSAIYLGALAAFIVPGFVGERLGWHYGFLVAAVGMAIGLTVYLLRAQRVLGDVGRNVSILAATEQAALTAVEWQRIAVALVQGLFTVVYAAAFYQIGGLLNLYVRDDVDRTIWDLEIPTPWFQTFSILAFLAIAPLLTRMWRRLDRVGHNPSASYKLAMGLAVLGFAYLVIAFGEEVQGAGSALAPAFWILGAYTLFGLGDALVWSNQISFVSKLAPARLTTFMIGGWYLCIGLGSWLTGSVAALAQGQDFSSGSRIIGFSCICCGLLLAAVTPWLRQFMHGAEQPK